MNLKSLILCFHSGSLLMLTCSWFFAQCGCEQVADVFKIHAASFFMVKMWKVSHSSCTHKLWSKRSMEGRCGGTGGWSGPMGTVDRKRYQNSPFRATKWMHHKTISNRYFQMVTHPMNERMRGRPRPELAPRSTVICCACHPSKCSPSTVLLNLLCCGSRGVEGRRGILSGEGNVQNGVS